MLHEICCQDVSGLPLIYSQSGKRVDGLIDWLGLMIKVGEGADLQETNQANHG